MLRAVPCRYHRHGRVHLRQNLDERLPLDAMAGCFQETVNVDVGPLPDTVFVCELPVSDEIGCFQGGQRVFDFGVGEGEYLR